MKQITDAEFEEIISSGRVVVDFFSTHCPPCKKLTPLLEDLESSTDAVFVKVNVDEEMEHASRNHVVQLPTLILFEDGLEVKRHIGLMPKPSLKSWLRR